MYQNKGDRRLYFVDRGGLTTDHGLRTTNPTGSQHV